tara:strand:+ start:233 stop:415 length:183 start_codon:yes stop_codon:yes gene_type:complete
MINAERFLIKLARLTNIYLWFVEGCNRITTSDFQGSMQSDVKVDAATFDKFNEGDDYCVK